MKMNTEVVIITGIIAGVAALNLVLLFAWFMLKSRRRNIARKLQIDQARASEKSTARLPVTSITLPRPPLPRPPLPASLPTPPRSRHTTEGAANYRQLVMSAQSSRRNKPERPANLLPSRGLGVGRAQSRTRRSHRAEVSTDTTFKDMLHVSERSLKRGPSTRSAVSADSASIYSAASAPLEFHDRVFQPMTLETIPATPGVVPSSDFDTSIGYNMRNDSGAIPIRESIASRKPLSEIPINNDFSVPDSLTPSSPITPPSPVAALNIEKNTRSSSTRRIRVLTSVPPLVSPPSSTDPPPIPLRSPMRP